MTFGPNMTENRLDGHKITVTQQGESIVLEAYTDSPVTRLVYELSIEDAQEIAHWLLDAVRLTQGAAWDGETPVFIPLVMIDSHE